jgi:hypothetical protein
MGLQLAHVSMDSLQAKAVTAMSVHLKRLTTGVTVHQVTSALTSMAAVKSVFLYVTLTTSTNVDQIRVASLVSSLQKMLASA